MNRKQFCKERDRIAFELGMLCLGYYDFGIRFESKGEAIPYKDSLDFRKQYDSVINRYAGLLKRKCNG